VAEDPTVTPLPIGVTHEIVFACHLRRHTLFIILGAHMNASAPKYRRQKEESPPPIKRKWGRTWDATERTSFSKSEIYKILNDPTTGVESFVYKGGGDKRSGCRMINLESLDAYLDRLHEEAKKKEAPAV
jgi:hypothetical protein